MTDVKLADSISASDVALAEGGDGSCAELSRRRRRRPRRLVWRKRSSCGRPKKGAARDKAPMALLPGAKVDDFEIVRLLGRGAFGHVYLARQLSLDRLVALKISANRGSEGRTMARLEHQHIVQVFSETVDPDFNQRLLCMQLVPGIGLEKLIGMLHAKNAASTCKEQGAGSRERRSLIHSLLRAPRPCSSWTGAELLGFIDRSGSLPTALDPSALHDREALGKMDAVEATAWFGTRLAEALDFAHRHGVLHRDIKPANILVNPYGRPMLADFNISSQPVGSESSGDEMFGGTFAYMSPEHLDAFNPGDPTGTKRSPRGPICIRSASCCSNCWTGRIGFPQFDRKAKMADTLRAMADERRQRGADLQSGLARRADDAGANDRPLPGAEAGRSIRERGRPGRATRRLPASARGGAASCRACRRCFAPILRRPFLWLVLLVVLPQVAGSIVNITYNTTQIVGKLTEAQQSNSCGSWLGITRSFIRWRSSCSSSSCGACGELGMRWRRLSAFRRAKCRQPADGAASCRGSSPG